LKGRGLYDKATIIVLADHGEGLGDHGEQEHGVFLYDEAIRVPLIVKMPRSAGHGRRIAQPVQHIDLVPTILDLVGAPRPGSLRGRSLKPILADQRDRVPEQGIYSEALYPRYHFGWSELYAITDDRYRLIKAPREELYDLQDDPGERRNILEDRAQTRVALRSALDRLVAGRSIDAPSQVSDEDRERLQALGYVGSHAEVATDVASETLPDPKDKVGVLEQYRNAVALAGERKFIESAAAFRQILADNRGMKDVWMQLANVYVRAGRIRDAVDAYKHLLEIDPANTSGLLGASAGLLKLKKLDEAAEHAEIAARVAPIEERRVRATAYELLAKIALRRRDGDEARRYATLAQETDPSLPLPIYIQALQLHTAGKFAEALPLFEDTLRQLGDRPVTLTEVHYYAGDTLARLGRNAEAEAAFKEEIRLFPQNARAYAGLAMLYRSLGRDKEVEQVIDAMTRMVPTSEGYALAIRLWTMFDEPQRAATLRSEARKRLGVVPALESSE
jgi:tetratricopeptide (TPR) repeat protein